MYGTSRKALGVKIIAAVALLAGSLAWAAQRHIEHTRLRPLLLQAVAHNDVRAVRSLLERGADPNAVEGPEPPPPTPLDLWRQLWKPSHQDVEGGPGYSNVLMIAAHNKNAAIVRLLLADGADVNARGFRGITALMLVAAE